MTTLDFRVLGPVQVLRGGAAVPLGGLKRRSVLALLIANRNRVVSVNTIADALWEERPPPSVTSSIQVAISGLRSTLAGSESERSGAIIETASPGYRLRIEDDQCDIARFRRGRELALTEQRAGRLVTASQFYRQALDEWSGSAYEDLRNSRFAADLAFSLDEERLATRESLIEVELALGRHRDLVGELAKLTADYPLRESMWTNYMTALFRCNRQADALAAYRLLRHTLMEQLGLEPSAGARQLEQAVLAQDPALAWSPTPAHAAATLLASSGPEELAPAHLRDQHGRCTPIGRAGLKIGRMADNTLSIEDPKVSRYHATIAATAAHYMITDHSVNGTRLNGALLTRSEVLTDGSRIEIGDARFEFRAEPMD